MQRGSRQAGEDFLLKLVDFGLAGAIFLVPLLMGGRHAIGQLALTVLSVTAAWSWTVRQSFLGDGRFRPTTALPILLLGAALVGMQIVALPPWLLERLSPRAAEILPLWNASGGTPGTMGRWSCISFTPAETLGGLVIFLNYAMLFLVAVQRVKHVEDIERLLRWCAMSAVMMAMVGIAQLVAGNGRFLWFYEHPFSKCGDGAHGCFSNRNHFAQFMALGIGPLIWWLQDALRRSNGSNSPHRSGAPVAPSGTAYFLALALGVVLFAGLLSLSRGGAAAMLVAVAVTTAICLRTGAFSRRLVGVLTAASVLIGLSLMIFGYDKVSNRLDDFSSGSIDKLDRGTARRTIWTAATQSIPDSLLLGTGVGSFRTVYPMHTGFHMDEGTEFTHAESSYLQDAVETGLVGSALTLAGIVLCCSWCFRGIRSSAPTRLRVCVAAIAGSFAAILVHGVVDFVWYVPACMAIVAILAACAQRVAQLSRMTHSSRAPRPSSFIPHPSSFAVPRPVWQVAAAIVTGLGVWMIADRIGPAVAQTHWDEYLVDRRTTEAQSATGSGAMSETDLLRRWIGRLEQVVLWQPSHASARLALADCHRRLFESMQKESDNPMPLVHIRDAARQSRFPSRAALDEWLDRAVGVHWRHLEESLRYIRAALALCPLEGRAYVYMADLSFLEGADAETERAYIGQAICVRPFDGTVLYAAANDALLAGDRQRWLEYTKRAYQNSRLQQLHVIRSLVDSWPTEGLPALINDILREFQPDREAARVLHELSMKRCPSDQFIPLVGYRARTAETEASKLVGTEAAMAWLEAQSLRDQLGDEDAALRCVQNALECSPDNYDVHDRAARCLLKNGMYAEAESHARWCLDRKPDCQAAAQLFRAVLKGRLDAPFREATSKDQSINR